MYDRLYIKTSNVGSKKVSSTCKLEILSLLTHPYFISKRTPSDLRENLPPRGFYFQYDKKRELEILHISIKKKKFLNGHIILRVNGSFIGF